MTDLTVFEKLVRTLIGSIAVNRAPTEDELRDACDQVRRMMPATDVEVEKIVRKLQSALDVAMDIGISIERDYEPWLMSMKAQKDADFWYYWNRYALYLEQDKQFASGVIATIDKVSDKIVDLAGDPTAPGLLHRRGLLIGDVQSGKTANYIAIMNKAADVGYKVIILLTGTVESLRRQTQERVDEGFIGRSSKAYLQRNSQTIKKGVGLKDSTRFATGFTTEASDFKTSTLRSMNVNLDNMISEPVVFVLKKNAKTLSNLINWLEGNMSSSGKLKYPLLLIDDEADNASINTRGDDDPTTINKSIRALLGLFEESSYIAVTATPFANIFILPEKTDEMENDDLFPSDYIYALDTPTNYIGGNELYGEDAEYANALIRIEDADDCFPYKHKQDIPISVLPDSLYDALRYFVLANAVRDMDGDNASHRSMLVNVSRYVAVQNKISDRINEWLYDAKRDIRNYCKLPEDRACQNDTIAMFRDDWYNTDYPFFSKTSVDWEDIQNNYLESAINGIEVRTINQRSSSKLLDYTLYSDTGLRVIAVGGLSLSRGLTLEGLMVSYFHRNTQMYDTLMQMGRWFGYRIGYEKLFRIWMPDDAMGWYAHITRASNELKEEIAKMNRLGATPREFGLRVRAHPTSLIITAKNKMKHSERIERWITLDGEFFETPRFRPSIDIMRANVKRADSLLSAIVSQCGNPVGSGNQPIFWSNVPRALICSFISKYENHPMNMEANGAALEQYINNNNSFAKWDVLVINNARAACQHSVDDLAVPIGPTTRQLSKKPTPYCAYGSKLRIGAMGLTRHGLSKDDREKAEDDFRELKRAKYEQKYGTNAEQKLKSMNFPDRAYLIKGRNPILILYYLKPDTEKGVVPDGFDMESDLVVGYGIGFPKLAGSDPIYAVYYINMVEQRQYMDDEIEEDQFDDIDQDS